jgi:hypothetical protein
MIRTALGALAVGKALTTPIAPAPEQRLADEATVGTGFTPETPIYQGRKIQAARGC